MPYPYPVHPVLETLSAHTVFYVEIPATGPIIFTLCALYPLCPTSYSPYTPYTPCPVCDCMFKHWQLSTHTQSILSFTLTEPFSLTCTSAGLYLGSNLSKFTSTFYFQLFTWQTKSVNKSLHDIYVKFFCNRCEVWIWRTASCFSPKWPLSRIKFFKGLFLI